MEHGVVASVDQALVNNLTS